MPRTVHIPISTTINNTNREENREIPVEVSMEVRIVEGAIVDAIEPLVENSVDCIPTSKSCPICQGETVRFRGKGKSMVYELCPNRKEPGHLSYDEIMVKVNAMRDVICPSGRFV